jgi:hypothetical protein
VRVRLLALPLLTAIVVPVASALASSGGIGVRLAGSTATTHDPRARSYIVERLAPGMRVVRRVEIRNSSNAPAAIAVYPAAARLLRGNFRFAAGHGRNELSSWTSVSRGSVHLQPGASTFETVTIDVPKTASAGERYAVVWAEMSAPAPAGGGVTLVNRVGVRMYVSVRPGGAPPPSFAIGVLTAERSTTGEPLVVATVRNSGGRTLDIRGTLTLSAGPGGLRAGPFPVTLRAALAPGASESARVRLDRRLPRGPWRAELRLTSGTLERNAAATITFPRYLPAARPPAASPLIRGGLILLALLAIAALVLLVTRRFPFLPHDPAAKAQL